MPESNKQAKRRQQKANREAGIGDEQGRMVRQKDPPKLINCTICQLAMKVTKTNTEITQHSESKHGKSIEECFPGATEGAAELVAAAASNKSGGGSTSNGPTKAEKKKKAAAGLDDLLNAGLSTKKKGNKK
ncbi:unnamed protein product [Cylindrotheca closterium]|uniref:At2g23090-like zinc-binding domain-containing protein n=1 Tax=Cylindrotheca closterium TaxID=2856 RepID=A0AAD2FPH7_9STRA|nr:unnamed protein product [Cylindrotheca closterium]